MSPSRRLAYAVLACLAGAGLAIYGATRTWSLDVVTRPGLPDLRTARTGADETPLLVGLALVALAGAGALLAMRGTVRRVLGGLLAPVGAAVAAAAVLGRAGLDAGRAGAGAVVWPAVCVLGGAMIVTAGLAAARHGQRWPVMGSRYERGSVPSPPAELGAGTGPLAAAGHTRPHTRSDHPDAPGPDAADNGHGTAPVDLRAAWDALDRGDDPTVS
jgi:uncharacterized membrane protein (TIGR02234 family)